MPDDALMVAIQEVLGASRLHGESYHKVWARLRFKGVRTSKRRVVLRLMRAHSLLTPQRGQRPRGPRSHRGTIRMRIGRALPTAVGRPVGRGVAVGLAVRRAPRL